MILAVVSNPMFQRGLFGYNPSDSCVVAKTKGILQGSVPLTKEWMIIKL